MTGFKQKKWTVYKFGTKEGNDMQLSRIASLDFSFVEAEENEVPPSLTFTQSLPALGFFSECFSLYFAMQEEEVEHGNGTETAGTNGWLHSYYPMQACQQVQPLISTGGHIHCLCCTSHKS